MNQTLFGIMPDGTKIYEIQLVNSDFDISIITYGGIIRKFVAFGTDIICGFDSLEGYLSDTSHQGALVGRYANRIDAGHFSLNGKEYQLECNSGGGAVHLHGGHLGFSRKAWDIVSVSEAHVTLRMQSPDGDQGYPGNLTADVTYTLGKNGLFMDYCASTDADTPINMTNHGYFNLDGCGHGSIHDHRVLIHADEYSLYDEHAIPRGHIPVAGTPLDFTTPHTIGERLSSDFPGYDHNYILSATPLEEIDGRKIRLAASADNGVLCFKLYTDQPCMQFYIGNSLDGDTLFKGGRKQLPQTTFCFEAQTEPNGPNRGEAILRPGETYRQTTLYAVNKL